MQIMKASLGCLLIVTAMVSATVHTPDSKDVTSKRQRRSLKVPIIGSLIGRFRKKEEESELPHLGKYPLWKVHRYHGISLQPVPLPSDIIPSNHPIPPQLHGEVPSIANVPNPHYAPQDIIEPPHNEYEHSIHTHSAPYHPAAPSAPYPPQGAPYPPVTFSAPYPPPSAPYPPPSAPYPPAIPPTEPHPPIFNAQLHSGISASAASAAAAASAEHAVPDEYAAPPEGDVGSSHDLQSMLPPSLAQKLHQFTSTLHGKERMNALLAIAANAQRLKSNAASSFQGVFNKFLGGAGGSSNVAIESGTYTNVPKHYPAEQGFFNRFKPIGTGISGSVLPNLPEVPPLPNIPGLQKLPAAPGLPHINLPEVSQYTKESASSGKYVSFNIPQAHDFSGAQGQAFSALDGPITSYGTPVQSSSGADSSTFFRAPEQGYGVPSSESSGGSISTFFRAPQQTYGLEPSTAASEQEVSFQLHQQLPQQPQPNQEGDRVEALQRPNEPNQKTNFSSQQEQDYQDMRMYLEPRHPAALPTKYSSHQQQAQQSGGELDQEPVNSDQ